MTPLLDPDKNDDNNADEPSHSRGMELCQIFIVFCCGCVPCVSALQDECAWDKLKYLILPTWFFGVYSGFVIFQHYYIRCCKSGEIKGVSAWLYKIALYAPSILTILLIVLFALETSMCGINGGPQHIAHGPSPGPSHAPFATLGCAVTVGIVWLCGGGATRLRKRFTYLRTHTWQEQKVTTTYLHDGSVITDRGEIVTRSEATYTV